MGHTMEETIEFPCGYKKTTKIKLGFFGEYHGHKDNYNECPLHGKKCVKSEDRE